MTGRREDGFTLIEVVVAVSLLGLVMAALSGVFVLLLRLAPSTDSTYSESHDAQLAATYWPTDVQSAEPVDGISATKTSCGAGPGLVGTTPVVRFRWTSPDRRVTKVAAYQLRSASGAAPQDLVRTFCVIGAPVAQTSTVVAHRVRSVEVSCITPLCVTSELTITEGSGYRFMVGGTRRVTP